MRSKSYKQIKEKISEDQMELIAAVQFLKENARAKFDETVNAFSNYGKNLDFATIQQIKQDFAAATGRGFLAENPAAATQITRDISRTARRLIEAKFPESRGLNQILQTLEFGEQQVGKKALQKGGPGILSQIALTAGASGGFAYPPAFGLAGLAAGKELLGSPAVASNLASLL